MLAVFRFRHINTVCFVGIDLVLYTKTHSTDYINHSEVFYYYVPSTKQRSNKMRMPIEVNEILIKL